jgi:hypothetical protein
MSVNTEFLIGGEASCADGPCGVVRRLIVDPVARTLTHLVVVPRSDGGRGRLVPVDLATQSGSSTHLRCMLAEFEALPAAEEAEWVPERGAGASQGTLNGWPYCSIGFSGQNNPTSYEDETRFRSILADTTPPGEISIHRGDQVHAADGDVGRVQGLVIDPQNHGVSQVLLQEGHLWGRRDVTIPIGSVTSLNFGVHLSLTKKEVTDLPVLNANRQDKTVEGTTMTPA